MVKHIEDSELLLPNVHVAEDVGEGHFGADYHAYLEYLVFFFPLQNCYFSRYPATFATVQPKNGAKIWISTPNSIILACFVTDSDLFHKIFFFFQVAIFFRVLGFFGPTKSPDLHVFQLHLPPKPINWKQPYDGSCVRERENTGCRMLRWRPEITGACG